MLAYILDWFQTPDNSLSIYFHEVEEKEVEVLRWLYEKNEDGKVYRHYKNNKTFDVLVFIKK